MSIRVILFVAVIAVLLGTAYSQAVLIPLFTLTIQALTTAVTAGFTAAISVIGSGAPAVATALGTILQAAITLFGQVVALGTSTAIALIKPLSALFAAIGNGAAGLIIALANALNSIVNAFGSASGPFIQVLLAALNSYLAVAELAINAVVVPILTIGNAKITALQSIILNLKAEVLDAVALLVPALCNATSNNITGPFVNASFHILYQIDELIQKIDLTNCTVQPACEALQSAVINVTAALDACNSTSSG